MIYFNYIRELLSSPLVFMMGFVLLNFLAFCVVLLCVFTFLVPCCDVLYDVQSFFTSSCLISSCVFLVYVHVVMSNICPIKCLYVLSSVMSATISTYKRCSVRLYLQLFVRNFMSYLRYLSLLAYSGVQYILCCKKISLSLRPVLSVPNVASFSRLSILGCSFGFLYCLFIVMHFLTVAIV